MYKMGFYGAETDLHTNIDLTSIGYQLIYL